MNIPLCQPEAPLFTIGDIHGRYDALTKILRSAADALDTGAAARVVFLGDIIDRGPGSVQCLDAVAEFRRRFPAQTELLMGNHEQFMFVSLLHPDTRTRLCAADNWTSSGGTWVAKLAKDRIDFRLELVHEIATGPLRQTLIEFLAARGLEFATWKSHTQSGNVLCVHAGVPPHADDSTLKTFLAQPALELPKGRGTSFPHWAWIRDGFLEEDVPISGRYIVHGHTRHDFADERAFSEAPHDGRINLDATGTPGHIAAALIMPGRVELNIAA